MMRKSTLDLIKQKNAEAERQNKIAKRRKEKRLQKKLEEQKKREEFYELVRKALNKG